MVLHNSLPPATNESPTKLSAPLQAIPTSQGAVVEQVIDPNDIEILGKHGVGLVLLHPQSYPRPLTRSPMAFHKSHASLNSAHRA